MRRCCGVWLAVKDQPTLFLASQRHKVPKPGSGEDIRWLLAELLGPAEVMGRPEVGQDWLFLDRGGRWLVDRVWTHAQQPLDPVAITSMSR